MINYNSTLAIRSTYKERNDCAVVAVSVACNQPYIKVHALIAAEGRRRRDGTYHHQWITVVNDMGYRPTLITKTTGRTVSSLHKQLDPTKRYIVQTRGHLLAYSHGAIEDWTGLPDRKPSRMRVTHIYEINPILSKNAIRKASRYNK